MAIKHFWYSLRDGEGIPMTGESVYIYKHGTSNELNIFDSTETQLSQPLTTDSEGIFEFYVKDIYSSGYLPSQKMTISWSVNSIDNLDIFDKMYQVDETSTNIDENKLISNQLAYTWETHKDASVLDTTLHNLLPVNETNSTDNTFNKLVNNNLMNEFYSLLVSASTITINTSGSIVTSFSVDTKGGSAPAWLDTTIPSAGDYYVDLNHALNSDYPLLSVWKTSNKKMVTPSMIESIDSDNIRIWINEDIQTEVSIVG